MKKGGARSQGYYVPCFEPGIHPVLGQEPKQYASQFFQLKVGAWGDGSISRNNRDNRDSRMLVV